MQNALMVNVDVYWNSMAILTLIADQNVFLVLIVPIIKLAYKENVRTHVLQHAARTLIVKWLVTYQCAVVSVATQEMHLFYVIQ